MTSCGIIMAGGTGSRLFPLTTSINKHLIPIYDKPMIYYPLSTLMLAGIKDICLIINREDEAQFLKLLGNGERFGVNITYLEQTKPSGIPEGYLIAEKFINRRNVVMILGDNVLLGQGMKTILENAVDIVGAKIFLFPVSHPEKYGVATVDDNRNIIEIHEKPKKPTSNLAIPGIYFTDNRVIDFARTLIPSDRGEVEIVDILRKYHSNNELTAEIFQRGIGWMDAGTVESLYEATETVRVLQRRQGLRFACPEEIAWRNGWIDKETLRESIAKFKNTEYGEYLDTFANKQKF
jgi:glucose-1-phosphate thymidylyltransferase